MALSHLSHDQESKTPKYAGCDDIKHRKAAIPHSGEGGTRGLLAFYKKIMIY